jgi:hypothetical protein
LSKALRRATRLLDGSTVRQVGDFRQKQIKSSKIPLTADELRNPNSKLASKIKRRTRSSWFAMMVQRHMQTEVSLKHRSSRRYDT